MVAVVAGAGTGHVKIHQTYYVLTPLDGLVLGALKLETATKHWRPQVTLQMQCV